MDHAMDYTFRYEFSAVLEAMQTNRAHGLSNNEAKARLQKYGSNQLERGEGISAFRILVHQVANAMTLVLIMAMAVALGIHDWISGGVIGGVVGINVVVGFFQEFSAEKTMNSLRSVSYTHLTLPTKRIV